MRSSIEIGRAWAVAAAAILVASALFASPASAEPSVTVQVRRDGVPVEATVFLRDADAVTGQCTTTGGTCRIEHLRPGRHYVWARDAEGHESVERLVLLPADGEVTLVVAAP